MNNDLPITLSLFLLAYLLGSFPSGYLVGKVLKGVDIRRSKFHNTGATNTWKTVGAIPGIFVGGLDIGKGMIATFLPIWLNRPDLAIWAGALAVVGHIWPVFIGFRGGKGLATIIGVAFVLAPLSLFVCLALWLVLKSMIHRVALANLIAFSLLPFLTLYSQETMGVTFGFAAMASLRWLVERQKVNPKK